MAAVKRLEAQKQAVARKMAAALKDKEALLRGYTQEEAAASLLSVDEHRVMVCSIYDWLLELAMGGGNQWRDSGR